MCCARVNVTTIQTESESFGVKGPLGYIKFLVVSPRTLSNIFLGDPRKWTCNSQCEKRDFLNLCLTQLKFFSALFIDRAKVSFTGKY